MAIIRSGWGLPPRTVTEMQPLTPQPCPVAISWLLARPMHVDVTLDLLMTDVPDLLRVAVVAPIGNSDHSSLSAVISTTNLFQTCVSLEEKYFDN